MDTGDLSFATSENPYYEHPWVTTSPGEPLVGPDDRPPGWLRHETGPWVAYVPPAVTLPPAG